MKYILSFIAFVLTSAAATVKIAWDHPDDASVKGYVVRVGPSSNNKASEYLFGYTNLVTITNIPDNLTVYLDVQSYNDVMRSVPSKEITFSTVPPSTPQAIRLTNNTVVVTVTVTPNP